jgi:probable rRNA maturation factor
MTEVAGAEEIAAVVYRQRGVKIALPALRKFLGRICQQLGLAETELVICFVTDAEMARMNEAFRQKPGPTDVLSFPAVQKRKRRTKKHRAGVPREGRYLGDIAIAPAVARRNARKYGRGLQTELRILMLHGLLHLQGYDHETDQGQMKRLEMKLRRRLELA